MISIHAPLTGSDGAVDNYFCAVDNFNPRSPHRERPLLTHLQMHFSTISIHAPLTGSDGMFRFLKAHRGISIHAPLTGSDTRGLRNLGYLTRFQSTLPSQGATLSAYTAFLPCLFQSTLPSQGATSNDDNIEIWFDISIHAPLTGSDMAI